MSSERSLLEVMAEHRARLVPIREAAEAGDPEAARAYAEGLALLQEAEAKQAEHERLLRETSEQLAQLEALQAKVDRLEQLARDQPGRNSGGSRLQASLHFAVQAMIRLSPGSSRKNRRPGRPAASQ